MLTHEELAAHYDDAVWIWVCRSWRDDDLDQEAARIHDRFGITSWPHLLVIDPRDDRVLERAGRSVDALQTALARGDERVDAPDEQAREALLASAREAAVRARADDLGEADLDHVDVVVRIRALRVLIERDIDAVLPRAEALLLGGNDTLRFTLLDAIQDRPSPELSPVLARLVAEAGAGIPSGNPNVLRGKAARALVTSGDARAIDALAPVAELANPLNSTTRTVVEALGAIGARGDADTRARVGAILLGAWPEAVTSTDDDRRARALSRYALTLVAAVTTALGHAGDRDDLPPLPSGWSPEERSAHIEAVESLFKNAE